MSAKWFNSYQPQTLQTAVILLYLNAIFAILFSLFSGSGFISLITIAGAAGAFGIANNKNWGFWTAVVASVIPAAASLVGLFALSGNSLFSDSIISVIINIALVVVLLHPLSREYQKSRFS
jgi:uncharacterized membrane protein (DUF2068 family)